VGTVPSARTGGNEDSAGSILRGRYDTRRRRFHDVFAIVDDGNLERAAAD